MGFLRKIFLLLLFTFSYLPGFSQNKNLAFKHLSLNEGLSQSPIFSIKQDHAGFIWIGSRSGLIRYDGYEFKTYAGTKDNNVNHRDIRSIQEDDAQDMWLGTSKGLFLFTRKTEQFSTINLGEARFVYCLLRVKGNKIWAGTDHGIKIIDCTTRRVTDFVPEKISGNHIYSLHLDDKSGNVWVGSANGLKCFNALTGATNTLPLALQKQLGQPNRKVATMAQEPDGDMWFSTDEEGLFWYQQKTGNCINYSYDYKKTNTIPANFIRDIYVKSPNELWIGTRNGLSIFNKKTGIFQNHQHRPEEASSLTHNTIWNIMQDKSGSLWLTTYAGGINVYNQANTNFSNIGEKIGARHGLNQLLVNAVYVEAGKGIWAGTDGGGLNFIDQKTGSVKYFSIRAPKQQKYSNIIKAIVKDSVGNLWLGTLDGLASFNPKSGAIKYASLQPHKKLTNSIIKTVALTRHGIWTGSSREGLKLFSYDGKLKKYWYYKEKNSISSNFVNALLPDSTGIWIATIEGLDFLDIASGRFTHYQNKTSKNGLDKVVLSIFRDSQKRLWLGTRNGLHLFDKNPGNTFFITQANGLAHNVVQAITEDKAKNIWVSTTNGLSKITFSASENSKQPGKFQVANFMSSDGLASNQWMQNAVFRSATGELYFGGVNGVSYFQPASIIHNKYPPVVVITDFLINNKRPKINAKGSPLAQPIELTQSIVLNYDQSFISFKFAALNYINAQKNGYAYKMEGLSYNKDWNYIGKQRSAVFTGLEPGDYIFKVKAANNDGVWSTKIRSIKITVLPPFWLTWWAYTFYVLAALTIFILIVRFFRRQAKLERDLYYEHLQFERQQELNQLKINFFTNISHEIRTPLTLIAAPVEKLVQETKNSSYINNQLILIQKNTNRLLKLVNELMDFRKTETGNMKLEVYSSDINDFARKTFDSFQELASLKNINYRFAGLEKPVTIYFDANQLEKVLFNLLSNAFKFTPAQGSVCLKLTEQNQQVQLSIIDSGPGIPYADQEKLFNTYYQGEKYNPKHSGTGIGLAFSKSIVELHHGEILFKSIPAGSSAKPETSFTVSLLKGNQHFTEAEIGVPNKEISIAEPEDIISPELDLEVILPDNLSKNGIPEYTILVVEDNEEVREFVMASLKDNYKVEGRENGLLGLELAITNIPDLIITDVMMPEMDGMEFCQKIKADERTSHIPIIMLTARDTQVHLIDGLETGADAYIAKPFSLQVLQLTIRNLLAARATMQKKFSQQLALQPKDVVITSTEGIFLSKLIQIIEERMEDAEFGVVHLATEVGMSQPVLYRKVKALSDLTVADFIKSIRLKRAACLLAQHKMTIADVATAVGFNDRKYFSKEFRKQFNQSPSEYMAEGISEDEEVLK